MLHTPPLGIINVNAASPPTRWSSKERSQPRERVPVSDSSITPFDAFSGSVAAVAPPTSTCVGSAGHKTPSRQNAPFFPLSCESENTRRVGWLAHSSKFLPVVIVLSTNVSLPAFFAACVRTYLPASQRKLPVEVDLEPSRERMPGIDADRRQRPSGDLGRFDPERGRLALSHLIFSFEFVSGTWL